MKKSKLSSILIIPMVALLLVACNGGTSEDTTSNETTDGSTSNTSGTGTEATYQSYYWVPSASQFGPNDDKTLSAGSLTHNGLTWSYSDAVYFTDDTDNNPSKGLHIGSSSKPQTAAWTLSTDFGENVTITNFAIVLSVGSNSSSSYSISTNTETIGSDTFSNFDPDSYEFSDLEIECSSLTITLKASTKAMYLQSISIGILTSADSSLKLSMDGESGGAWGAGFTPQATVYNVTTDLDSLYAPITDSMSGETLRKALREISSVKTQYTYGDLRYDLLYTDEDPANPGYLYGLYDGKLLPNDWDYGNTWNREHVWPCAHMSGVNEKARPDNTDKGPYTDMHNIRVSDPSSNSAKADYFVGNTNQSSCFYVNTGEGDHRGDTARILLYMYTEYDGLILSDDQSTKTDVTYGYLSTILEWNTADPVDDFEKQRNDRIEEYQGNRNPFIDHPEYAERLFN